MRSLPTSGQREDRGRGNRGSGCDPERVHRDLPYDTEALEYSYYLKQKDSGRTQRKSVRGLTGVFSCVLRHTHTRTHTVKVK